MMKKIVSTLLIAGMMFNLAVPAFAYTPAEPKEGYVAEYTLYDTLEYNGDEIMSVTPKLLSSGVTRYKNHSNGYYYAKGATNVVESTTGAQIYHTTTVRLVKGKTVLVEGTNSGTGEVWAETPETPTKGTAKVYWKTN